MCSLSMDRDSSVGIAVYYGLEIGGSKTGENEIFST